MKKTETHYLTESAVMIALGTVLSMLKFEGIWAFGGGVTVCSMLPMVLISYRWGVKRGLMAATVYALLQMLLGIDNVQYATSVWMAAGIILLDYLVAYGVLGLSGLVAPMPLVVQPALLEFDMLVMVAVAVACLPVFFTGATIARWEGAVFLGYYIAYMAFVVLTSQRHESVATFALVMQTVVLPLTILTLLIVTARAWKARKSA